MIAHFETRIVAITLLVVFIIAIGFAFREPIQNFIDDFVYGLTHPYEVKHRYEEQKNGDDGGA